ncbi:hypothetical protein Dip510_001798 [Elusimicrobium posterum]|uniref:hypothetical protein n=1 Tax=Elusimicrobium posterum TaxID=3116653 RepID=UPI003C739F8A
MIRIKRVFLSVLFLPLLALFAINSSGQDVYINNLFTSTLFYDIDTPVEGDFINSGKSRLIFRYYGEKAVNVRAAFYVENNDHLSKIINVPNKAQAETRSSKAVMKTLERKIYTAEELEALEANGFVVGKEMQTVKMDSYTTKTRSSGSSKTSLGRASWSEYNQRMGSGDPAVVAKEKAIIEKNHVAIWKSEVQTTVPTEEYNPKELVFDFTYMTNQYGTNNPIWDSGYYVLENADSGEVLELLYVFYNPNNQSNFSFANYHADNFTVDSASQTRYHYKTMFSRPATYNFYLTQDPYCVQFITDEALRKGNAGILAHLESECMYGGVIAYAEDIGPVNEYDLSEVVWEIKDKDGNPFTKTNTRDGSRTFYMMMIMRDAQKNNIGLGKVAPATMILYNSGFELPNPYIATGIENAKYNDDDLTVYSSDGELKFKIDPSSELNSKQLYAQVVNMKGQQIAGAKADLANYLNGQGISVMQNAMYVVRIVDKDGNLVATKKVLAK